VRCQVTLALALALKRFGAVSHKHGGCSNSYAPNATFLLNIDSRTDDAPETLDRQSPTRRTDQPTLQDLSTKLR